MDTLIDIAELADDLRRVTVEVTDADELLGSGVDGASSHLRSALGNRRWWPATPG